MEPFDDDAMKLLKLVRRWKGMRNHDSAPLLPHATNIDDRRLAVHEMLAAGVAADPALFFLEEIERLGESFARDF